MGRYLYRTRFAGRSRVLDFKCGLYFANQIRCNHVARSANARALAALV